MSASEHPPFDFGQVELPAPNMRKVLQHWKMVEPPALVFRSIEMVDGDFFMVARVVDEDGFVIGGKHGLQLRRVDYNEYHLANGGHMIYQVTERGDLLGFDIGAAEPTMRCVPIDVLPPLAPANDA